MSDNKETSATGEPTFVDRLRQRDDMAWRELMTAYGRRLRGLARERLLGLGGRGSQAESVVNEAMASLWKLARAGRLKPSDTSESLWSLLAAITNRRAIKRILHDNAAKRGKGQVQREGDFNPAASPLVEAAGAEPEPLDELCQQEIEDLIEALDVVATRDDEQLLLLLWMQETSEEDMAHHLGYKTVGHLRLKLAALKARLKEFLDRRNGSADARGGE